MNDHQNGALVSRLARASAAQGQSTAKTLALALLPLLLAATAVVAG